MRTGGRHGRAREHISNHLAKLRAAGLVRATRHCADARWVYYERDEEACVTALGRIMALLA
jgi:DNA-binding transcriptional ArsR family regulator